VAEVLVSQLRDPLLWFQAHCARVGHPPLAAFGEKRAERAVGPTIRRWLMATLRLVGELLLVASRRLVVTRPLDRSRANVKLDAGCAQALTFLERGDIAFPHAIRGKPQAQERLPIEIVLNFPQDAQPILECRDTRSAEVGHRQPQLNGDAFVPGAYRYEADTSTNAADVNEVSRTVGICKRAPRFRVEG
jgi:hypothetical protein